MKVEGDPQTYAIIGAAMEVHRELRDGFLESVYKDALAVELTIRSVPFDRERKCPVRYKGGVLPSYYQADFVCFSEVIVEIKAIRSLSITDDAQVINYLKCTGFHRALLLNFGAASLQHKRLVLESNKSESSDSVVL